MNKIDFNPEKISELFQQAVDKAIENHRRRGESIAVSDKYGNVRVITAEEIPQFLADRASDINENVTSGKI